jgi:uncharacterized tellurite resistance protein B-like protein
MNPTSNPGPQFTSMHDPAVVVRDAVQSLNTLDSSTANHLASLAFVLIRVARADGRVCGDERLRMEQILVEDAGIAVEHAVLVTEIACHRVELADCGSSYAVSRELRSSLDAAQRQSIVKLLAAVARADGIFATVERHEIAQIAGELGIDASEVPGP